MNTLRTKILKKFGYKVRIDLRELRSNPEYLYTIISPNYTEQLQTKLNVAIIVLLIITLFGQTANFSALTSYIQKYTFSAQAHTDNIQPTSSMQTVQQYTLPTGTDDQNISTEKLMSSIQNILGSNANKYGMYAKDLQHNFTIGSQEYEVFSPASIYKVPLAMLVLKDIQSGKISFEKKIPIKKSNKAYATDILWKKPNNSLLTIREYLQYMIVESDNTAMLTLEEELGGVIQVNQRLQTELGVINLFREPSTTTAREVGDIFEILYSQIYLSESSTDYLLNLLLTTDKNFQTRIPARLPKNAAIKVAHKVGQLQNGNLWVYEDAGIVYGENTDFIIVVLNKDVTIKDAEEKISKIAELLYEYLN